VSVVTAIFTFGAHLAEQVESRSSERSNRAAGPIQKFKIIDDTTRAKLGGKS
jgi:hypothetical protein